MTTMCSEQSVFLGGSIRIIQNCFNLIIPDVVIYIINLYFINYKLYSIGDGVIAKSGFDMRLDLRALERLIRSPKDLYIIIILV